MKALHTRAQELQLDVLCEVHDADELNTHARRRLDMIGVNNRNLHTFKVDLNTSLELVGQMPESVVKVAESGIETREDIERLQSAGFNAFLIGESRMRAERPGDALRSLTGRSVVVPMKRAGAWVEVCGTTSLADARISIDQDDALGFVFAPYHSRWKLKRLQNRCPLWPERPLRWAPCL